jgi:hypothetical protein
LDIFANSLSFVHPVGHEHTKDRNHINHLILYCIYPYEFIGINLNVFSGYDVLPRTGGRNTVEGINSIFITVYMLIIKISAGVDVAR